MQCPACGSTTNLVTDPFATSPQSAKGRPQSTENRHQSAEEGDGPPVEALLDNIRSVFNVGAMFRTADGAGLHRLHLCGITATPEHPKVAKTALGAERITPWTHHNNAVDATRALKARGFQLWALERQAGSESLFAADPLQAATPIVLVVGNELAGIDPQLLDLCDRLLHIPMEGVKESLNVAIAFGIAAYYLRHGSRRHAWH